MWLKYAFDYFKVPRYYTFKNSYNQSKDCAVGKKNDVNCSDLNAGKIEARVKLEKKSHLFLSEYSTRKSTVKRSNKIAKLGSGGREETRYHAGKNKLHV